MTGPRIPSTRRGSQPGLPVPSTSHVRDRALLAHATQVDPDGPWFAVPLEVHKSAWPTEDWELVRSLVDDDHP